MWVERMMRECKQAKDDGVSTRTIDTATLEGLLYDSLRWRHERAAGGWREPAAVWLEQKAAEQETINRQCPEHAAMDESWRNMPAMFRLLASELRKPREKAVSNTTETTSPSCVFRTGCQKQVECRAAGKCMSDFAINLLKADSKRQREAFANEIRGVLMKLDNSKGGYSGPMAPTRENLVALIAYLESEPARAAPGTLEIGVSPDEREVIANLPYTPDNGSGFVHFAFSPRQALNLAAVFIKKARECKAAVLPFGGTEKPK